jgi:hypothetical protein
MGRALVLIASTTLVLWRVLVVGVNNISAIHRSRWIDSSIWLAEDPLAKVELWLATSLVPGRLNDRTLMYLADLAGELAWMAIAISSYLLLRRASVVQRLDATRLRPFAVFVLAAATLLFAYFSGFLRLFLAHTFDLRNPWLVQIAGILSFVVFANLPLALFFLRKRVFVSGPP